MDNATVEARRTTVETTGHTVVHVTPFYPPRLGGVERVAQCVAELLAERHDVQVITTRSGSGGAPTRQREGRVLVRRHRAREIAHTPVSVGVVLDLLALPRNAIVHAHIAHAFFAEVVWLTSLVRRRSFVIHFHLDVDASGPFGRLLPVYKRYVLGPVLRRAGAVIALSASQAEFLQRQYRVLPENVIVIPNGVDSSFYQDRGPGEGARSADAPMRLLFVGRLDAQKNVIRLLDAMRRVSTPVELVIVGDGEQRALVETHLAAAGMENVQMVGARRGTALLDWYAWADAFVLPSDKEGMPLVLLEAMASGLAVIATDVPGTRELVEGVGLLADPDADSLGDAIERVASDEALRARLASQAVRRARDHSWAQQISTLERVYNRVVPAQ